MAFQLFPLSLDFPVQRWGDLCPGVLSQAILLPVKHVHIFWHRNECQVFPFMLTTKAKWGSVKGRLPLNQYNRSVVYHYCHKTVNLVRVLHVWILLMKSLVCLAHLIMENLLNWLRNVWRSVEISFKPTFTEVQYSCCGISDPTAHETNKQKKPTGYQVPGLASLQQACPGGWPGWGKAVCRAVGAAGRNGARCELLQGPRLKKRCPVQRLRPATPGSTDSSTSWYYQLL